MLTNKRLHNFYGVLLFLKVFFKNLRLTMLTNKRLHDFYGVLLFFKSFLKKMGFNNADNWTITGFK